MTVQFRGVTLDSSTVGKLLLTEAWVGHPIVLSQGSYSTGVSASAGTHAGGGACDVECAGDSWAVKVAKVHYLRACVGIAWHRPYNWDGAGGGEHIHCLELHNPNLSQAAVDQVAQWYAGENGLAGRSFDGESVDVAAGRPLRITRPPVPVAPPVVAVPQLPVHLMHHR